jgi:hypothetical protein
MQYMWLRMPQKASEAENCARIWYATPHVQTTHRDPRTSQLFPMSFRRKQGDHFYAPSADMK